MISGWMHFAEGDFSVCQELRNYANDLRYSHSDIITQYAPARPCPEDYKYALNMAETSTSASENINLLDEFIGQVRQALETEEPKSCLSRVRSHVCGSIRRRRNRLQVALTFASFFKAGRLFRDGLIVLALVEIQRLKMMRIQMEGVPMHEIFALEDSSLNDLADACENDPQEALGVSAGSSDRWVENVYRRLMALTDPGLWELQKQTMELVRKVVEHSYRQLHSDDEDLLNP